MTVSARNSNAYRNFQNIGTINVNDAFEINFPYLENDEYLTIYIRDQNDIETKILDTDYKIEHSTGVANVWGKCVFLKGFENVKTLTIERTIPIDQQTAFDSQTVFSETTEDALDKLTMLVQDNQFKGQTLHAPIDDNLTGISLEIPPANERINKVLGFDEKGQPIAVSDPGTAKALRQQPMEEADPSFELDLFERRNKFIAFDAEGSVDLRDVQSTVYTAGENITIENNVISAKDTTYTAGENINIDSNNTISSPSYTGGRYINVSDHVIDSTLELADNVVDPSADKALAASMGVYLNNQINDLDAKKQNQLIAGDNIQISSNNIISTPSYSAGDNVEIENYRISVKALNSLGDDSRNQILQEVASQSLLPGDNIQFKQLFTESNIGITGNNLWGLTTVKNELGFDRFLAVGDWGSIALSTDGSSWKQIYNESVYRFNEAAFGNGTIVVVGVEGTKGVVVVSDDHPFSFEQRFETSEINEFFEVKWIGDRFIIVGNGSKFVDTKNGADFITYSTSGNYKYHGIAYANGYLYLAYYTVQGTGSGIDVFAKVDTDQQENVWLFNKTISLELQEEILYLFDIEFGNNTVVAVGQTKGGAGIMLSKTDENNVWEKTLVNEVKSINCIKYIGGEFIAVGSNKIIRTFDGIKYQIETITDDNTKEFWGIASNGKNLCILAKAHKAFTAEAARYITAAKYQAGENINISDDNIISSPSYTGGKDISVSDHVISSTLEIVDNWTTPDASKALSANIGNKLYLETARLDLEKQDKLSAGSNITIDNGTISAKDTTYTAGKNISIENNVISSSTDPTDIVDNLNDSSTDKALSANMGKILNETKQIKLKPGVGITITEDGVISAFLDDSDWKSTTMPLQKYWSDCTYGADKFVAVASELNQVAYSTDGISWELQSTSWSNSYIAPYICFGGGKFVVIFTGESVVSCSTDGLTWANYDLPLSEKWNCIAYGNGVFVALSFRHNDKDSGSDVAIYSKDGMHWERGSGLTKEKWASVAFGNGHFIAISFDTNKYAHSIDGITWTVGNMPSATWWNDIVFGNGRFVAIASHFDEKIAYTEIPLINWQTTSFFGGEFNSIAFGDGKFCVATYDRDEAYISSNGISWEPYTLPKRDHWNTTCYGYGKFITIASANSNSVAYKYSV